MRSVTRCVARDPEQWKVDSPKAWSMVFAAFLIFFAPFGLAHSFSIFIVSLTNDFHVTRADIALVITINMTLSALAGVISGPLTDRYGPKRVMCLGLVIWLVGSLITTYAETFALVYFTQGILAGVGGGFLAPPVMAVVPMWFDKYRSTAVGFAVLGSGLGNVLFALLGQELLRQLGWREAQRVMVLVAGGMICIAIILIDRRTAPEQHTGGLFHMAKRLVRVPAYRYFLLTGFFFQWGFYIPYIHLLPSMNDLGLGGDAQGLA